MLLPLIDLVIVFHCVIFSLFFFFRRGGLGRTNLYLGVLLFLLSVISLPYALKPTNWLIIFPYLTDMEWPAGFLFAPVFYWYVREMIGEKINYTLKEYLQLIPAILVFLYFSKFYFLNSEDKTAYISLITNTYIPVYEVMDALFFPYIQGYFIYIIVYLSRRKNTVTGVYLSNLKWLRNYTVLLFGFGLFGLLVFMLKLPQVYIDILPLASAGIYLMLIFRFIQQSGKVYNSEGAEEPKPKYLNSNLSQEEGDRLNIRLREVMEVDKKYLDPELTLQSLSQILETTPHYLSRVINQYHQKNFSEYIKFFRISEAQKKILENEQLKLEAIGYECGFNTKTTFNAAFKKVTGMTPGEYRKKYSEKVGAEL